MSSYALLNFQIFLEFRSDYYQVHYFCVLTLSFKSSHGLMI